MNCDKSTFDNIENIDIDSLLNEDDELINEVFDLVDDEKIKAINEDANNLKLTRYSLNQRINDHVCDLFDNEKFVRKNKKQNEEKTGQLLKINEIPNLAVIDIDINKSLNDEERDEVRNNIIECLEIDEPTKNNWFIVKTTSGGLHIYANIDGFKLGYNRNIKCYESDEFDVDIFGCVDYKKVANVCRYGTKAMNKYNDVCE